MSKNFRITIWWLHGNVNWEQENYREIPEKVPLNFMHLNQNLRLSFLHC